jgi:hypothetical protein
MYAVKSFKIEGGVEDLRKRLISMGYKKITLFKYVKGSSTITINIKE